ncbi:KpsF/GutQ family sugar-phosphate isomerase [Marasmitruncus massiliensis]|jgi:arabinose-5-phosphate isomerase|uniref:KpsF/GutQ family sugar-phosphate isomerase n=1 Tax=Marasmitruncus massiliensis TaxID=1944642 RepID=UPI000C7CB8AB|nr:SIS domain-containing protein [Marasmitruncus massiliensis]MBE6907316.1 SIS domain-containing protein [Oscillospiraceae bacterium]
MDQESRQALHVFLEKAKTEFNAFADTIGNDAYDDAVQVILDAQKNKNRVHITGIGKPSHVANYMASLLSSTGTPTYFLHGTEAVHGSCGQLVPGDVVICISNSGETAELKATATAIKNNGCKIIGVTGNPESWLAKISDAHLFAGVKEEGGPLNRAPRASILAEILVLQGLSIVLQSIRGLSPQEYVTWHPGGSLGKLRDNEK